MSKNSNNNNSTNRINNRCKTLKPCNSNKLWFTQSLKWTKLFKNMSSKTTHFSNGRTVSLFLFMKTKSKSFESIQTTWRKVHDIYDSSTFQAYKLCVEIYSLFIKYIIVCLFIFVGNGGFCKACKSNVTFERAERERERKRKQLIESYNNLSQNEESNFFRIYFQSQLHSHINNNNLKVNFEWNSPTNQISWFINALMPSSFDCKRFNQMHALKTDHISQSGQNQMLLWIWHWMDQQQQQQHPAATLV